MELSLGYQHDPQAKRNREDSTVNPGSRLLQAALVLSHPTILGGQSAIKCAIRPRSKNVSLIGLTCHQAGLNMPLPAQWLMP
jgi:hypothetical protein